MLSLTPAHVALIFRAAGDATLLSGSNYTLFKHAQSLHPSAHAGREEPEESEGSD
jgi:hypothetical protein